MSDNIITLQFFAIFNDTFAHVFMNANRVGTNQEPIAMILQPIIFNLPLYFSSKYHPLPVLPKIPY